MFIKYADTLWNDPEREAFIDWIAEHADEGDVIVASAGLRKIRWSRQGMGKRGGTRVIYFIRHHQGQIVLLLVYAKAKFDNLSPEFLERLRRACDEF